ncbi:MAG: M4 family metallopeptidase [Candidatus Marinimicrobia bacterium]|nr:M4 family metallopeptidase [Candidatus Neomarinimicrobiota bacterium]
MPLQVGFGICPILHDTLAFNPSPDTYGSNDDLWCAITDTCDFVHINSGVQNYWFYLLAEGGTGTNENGDSYDIATIGRDKAAQIAWRNTTIYLSGAMGYADARQGAKWAASDLFGGLEVTQVLNAWSAVGVGPSMPFDITLQNETVVDDTLLYVAGNNITAGPAYVIQSGLVLLLAKNVITLKPGFHAKAGSNFNAYVGDFTTPSLPDTPTALNIVPLGITPLLEWDAVSNATSYRVYRRYGVGNWSNIGNPSGNAYADQGARIDVSADSLLQYYVTAVNSWGESGPFNIASALGYLLKEKPGIPSVYALHHAYPNPFNPTVTIRYDLPEPVQVRLVVYDMLGREVARLVKADMAAGYHAALWHGRDATGRPVASGLYIARLVTPKYTKSIKMILLK